MTQRDPRDPKGLIPMTQTLTAALADTGPAKRRGGRAARLAR